VLRFRLRKDGTVELVVRNAGCSVLGRKRVHADRGVNRVRFNGRLRGRPLAPGRYTIDLVVIRHSESRSFGAVAVEVLPPNVRLTGAQLTQPLVNDCSIAFDAPALPVAVASAGPPARSDSPTYRQTPRATKRRTRTAALGVGQKPPRLPLPGAEGSPMWLGVLLLVLVACGVAGLAVYVVRFVRGSWAP
jgi:hypothetical protein